MREEHKENLLCEKKDMPCYSQKRLNLGLKKFDENPSYNTEYLNPQIKQLLEQNKSLVAKIESLEYDKKYNEGKYIDKIKLQEEILVQFQKQKNYQIQLLNLKYEQKINLLTKQNTKTIQELNRDNKHLHFQFQEKVEQVRYLSQRNQQLKRQYQSMKKQFEILLNNEQKLIEKVKDTQLSKKKSDIKIIQLEKEKTEMEGQIRLLLEIQYEKSKAISQQEINIKAYQQTEKRLNQKLEVLSKKIIDYQQNIQQLSQDSENLKKQNQNLLQKLASIVKQKEETINKIKEYEINSKNKLSEQKAKETRRQKQVEELMAENQRLYKELAICKHTVHQLSIKGKIRLKFLICYSYKQTENQFYLCSKFLFFFLKRHILK